MTDEPGGGRSARAIDTGTAAPSLPASGFPAFSTRPWMIAAITLAYVAVLHYAYEKRISPLFGYSGYDYRPPDTLRYGLAIALVVGLAVALPRRIAQPSHLIVWVLFIVAAAPSVLVPQYADVAGAEEATQVGLWVATSFLVVTALGTRRLVQGFTPRVRLSARSFWLVVTAVSAVVYTWMFLTVGLSVRVPSLSHVYDVRFDYRDQLTQTGLLGYLIPLQANVVNPVVVIRGLHSRQWLWIAVGFAGQVLIFSVTGFKLILFSTPALIAVALVFRRGVRPAGITTLLGAVVAATGALVVDGLARSIAWTSLVVRRFLITPGLLTAAYVYVFADLDKARWGYSFLGSFVDYPYSSSPPFIVGAAFMGSDRLSANANLFADGYANFGYAGMLVECLVLVGLLWAIDDVARDIPVAISSLVFLLPTISLSNSSVFTTVLSHGFLAGMVVCSLMPRTGWDHRRPARHPSRRSPSAAPITSLPASGGKVLSDGVQTSSSAALSLH